MRVEFGGFRIDTEQRSLTLGGERVPVEPRVFDLLAYLIDQRDRAVSTDELLDAVWPGVSVNPAALSQAVHKARQAVGDDGERQAVLRTEHGHGFRFVADVSPVAAPGAGPPASSSVRTRWITAAGVAALLLAVAAIWLPNRPISELPPSHSIAVLPFVNLSGDPGQELLSDGISEALLTVLASVKGLRVTSRTSAFAFKDKNISVPELAAELHVDHVLEGTFQRVGNRIRISAQLIDTETDSHLWSASYDRELTDIFAVQDEIAARVGEALEVALLRADSSPIQPTLGTSIECYTDYLLARHKRALFTFAGIEEAEHLLKSVIERDPNYAPAYAALAGVYQDMAIDGLLFPSEASARMAPLVEQALSLDDELAEAWQQLAYIRQIHLDLEGARAAQDRALELEPQNPEILIGQVRRWLWTHEPERGLVYADRLLRVDPLSLPALDWIGDLYQRLDRLDDAERMVERSRSIDPKSNLYLWDAWHLALIRGDLVAALGFMEESVRIDLGDPAGPQSIAQNYLDLGDIAATEFWNDVALRRDPEAPRARITAALLHLQRGEEAEAVAVASELTRPDSHDQGTKAMALRIMAGPELAAGNYEEIITRYLTQYPALADGQFPPEWLSRNYPLWDSFLVTLDLASAYLHAGNAEKAESLLSLVESELPHWSRKVKWGHGFADVELHALRGEKAQALAALREHAATGTRYMWRWQVLYNSNLESIRDTPEFAAIVAEFEADMATQLARVRELERSGDLAAIPRGNANLH